jgi:16S rRNA U1498 N3-methylase RsmE
MSHTPHLYLPGSWEGGGIPLTDAQCDHLVKVLRRDVGSPVTYTDGNGAMGTGWYRGDVIERGDELQVARRREWTLAVAPPRSRDRQRFLVEKLGELGVARLTWLAATHATGRPASPRRTGEWAIAALEQSRGAWLLDIEADPRAWEELESPIVVCDPAGGDDPGAPATVVIGPEGGWAEGEIPQNARSWRLADTILRVETAALVAAVRLS